MNKLVYHPNLVDSITSAAEQKVLSVAATAEPLALNEQRHALTGFVKTMYSGSGTKNTMLRLPSEQREDEKREKLKSPAGTSERQLFVLPPTEFAA